MLGTVFLIMGILLHMVLCLRYPSQLPLHLQLLRTVCPYSLFVPAFPSSISLFLFSRIRIHLICDTGLQKTWEDPNSTHPETKAKGDNDPIDVCEIGEEVGYPGQIKQVKILGTMALLDEGETDWKLIAIDVNDPLAPKLNDIEDVERHLPGLLRATNEFWRIYKV